MRSALVLGVVVAVIVGVTACSRHTTQSGDTASPETVPGVAPAVTPTAAMQDGKIHTPDGRNRSYHLYVPTSLPTGQPVPLLVAMHGGFGSGPQYAENSNFAGLAEANQFIVVFPDGVGVGPDGDLTRTWNGGSCCGPAERQQVDDVTFISQLIDFIEQSHSIDSTRVFAAGHSNGGIMAYRLACELSDKIVAIGVQSSSLELSDCQPGHPVSVIHVHGTADQNLPIDGGVGPGGLSGVDFNPPIDGIHTLASADGCPSTPISTADAGNADLSIQTWQPCRDQTTVQFVTVVGATHAWMGSPAPPTRLLGGVYLKYDSSAAIWAFLVAHPRSAT